MLTISWCSWHLLPLIVYEDNTITDPQISLRTMRLILWMFFSKLSSILIVPKVAQWIGKYQSSFSLINQMWLVTTTCVFWYLAVVLTPSPGTIQSTVQCMRRQINTSHHPAPAVAAAIKDTVPRDVVLSDTEDESRRRSDICESAERRSSVQQQQQLTSGSKDAAQSLMMRYTSASFGKQHSNISY